MSLVAPTDEEADFSFGSDPEELRQRLLAFYVPWHERSDQLFAAAPDFATRRCRRRVDPELERFQIASTPESETSSEQTPTEPAASSPEKGIEAEQEQAYLDRYVGGGCRFHAIGFVDTRRKRLWKKLKIRR